MPPTDGAAQERERALLQDDFVRMLELAALCELRGDSEDTEYDALQERFLALLGAAPSGEPEDDCREAFESVMAALNTALDGDSDYSFDPAELVWRLRNQRDEALAGAAPAERDHELALREIIDCEFDGHGWMGMVRQMKEIAKQALAAAPREQPEPHPLDSRAEAIRNAEVRNDALNRIANEEPPAPGETREGEIYGGGPRLYCPFPPCDFWCHADTAPHYESCPKCRGSFSFAKPAPRAAPTGEPANSPTLVEHVGEFGEAARLVERLEERISGVQVYEQPGVIYIATEDFDRIMEERRAAAHLLRGERASEDGGA